MGNKQLTNRNLAGHIIKDFNLGEDQFDNISYEFADIKKKLIQILDFLLEKDFERLLNAMYRLDINEKRFREVITGQMGNNISEILAEMILKREQQKVQTRFKYRKKD